MRVCIYMYNCFQEVTAPVSSRCLAGAGALTTRRGITARSVPHFTTIVPGGRPTAAAGRPTLAKVSECSLKVREQLGVAQRGSEELI